MGISLDLDTLFSVERKDTLLINGVSVDVIAGRTQQKRMEFDGAVVETRELLLRYSDFPSLYVGEEMTVDGIEWFIDDLLQVDDACVSVSLARYIS